MDFFEHQDKARRKTVFLVFLFTLAIVLIIATVYAALTAVISVASGRTATAQVWNPQLLMAVGGAVLASVTIASAGKLLSLRGGGHAVAEMMGGRLVQPDTSSHAERQLINIVEEMALASGVAVPLVYVIDNEEGINAFAAGHGPEDAAVAVTSGLLKTLDRDELQGVIAHEFSHILNRDVRLNLRLTGIVFGILFLGIAGRIVLRTLGRGRIRGGGKNEGGGIMVVLAVGVVLLIVGYVGTALGRMIQSAVSRQREFLADASAVQFTRNPVGIAGALKKIGTAVYGSKLDQPKSEEISHTFFASFRPFNAMATLWATHPPLDQRIKRLDPSFDGMFFGEPSTPPSAEVTPGAMGFNNHDRVKATPTEVIESVGSSPWDHLSFDDIIHIELPDILTTEVKTSFGAVCAMYALLLSDDQEVARKQIEILESTVTGTILKNVQKLRPITAGLDTHARLPLVDLATPALRQISEGQYRRFRENIDRLIEADNYLSVFERSLQLILQHRLDASFGIPSPSVGGSQRAHLHNVLSTLAKISSDSEIEVKTAFNAGARGLLPSSAKPTADVSPRQFNHALHALSNTNYRARKKIVRACAEVVLADETVTLQEAEILRAVIEALNCPLPPFLPAAIKPN